MFNRYFGNYILQKKIITPEQLKRVLSEQKSERVKLGVLAIEAGYMTALQVESVHKLQVIQDKRFGEIAIAEGLMDEETLMTLLNKQKTSQVMLGQILVDEELVSYEDYERLLTDYKKDSGFSDEEIEILKSNNTDDIVSLIINIEQTDEVEFFAEYVELFLRNIVRFIDRDIIIEKPSTTTDYDYRHYACQNIIGDHSMETGIAADDEVFAKFASIYAEEELEEIAEMADAVGEFMNSQNGLFISNLYHNQINCDLEPQKYLSEGMLTPRNRLLVVPCEVSFGKFDIIFNI